MRFGVFTCESHQDLGIFAYVQPLYSHLCLLSHTCEYLLSYENRCWCDHKYFNISESVKFFKVLISVPKLDRKAWIFPTFFFVKFLKFSKKSHICEAQEPHMWLYSHMWVRTVSYTDKTQTSPLCPSALSLNSAERFSPLFWVWWEKISTRR